MVSARSAFLRSRGQTHLLLPWYGEVHDEESRSDELLNMLSHAHSLKATEPRDKIFAILGISFGIDEDDETSLIDYSLPVVNVYRNFAEFVIESSHSYDILSTVAATLTDGMPYWVPDWGVEIGLFRTILSTFPSEDEESLQTYQQLVRHSHDWLAAGDTAGKSLVCVGRVIGKITEMTTPIQVHADEEWGSEGLRDRHKDDEEELNYLSDSAHGTSDRNDVLRTDLLGVGHRPHKRLEKIVALPAISTTTEQEANDHELEEFFPYIRSNTRTGFFPAGTFAPLEHSEPNIIEENLNSNSSFFSLHTLKSLLGKAHQIDDPSTSEEFAVIPGSMKAYLLQLSRKTAQWTENGDILARGHVMIDKTSIIDGRSFAKFTPVPVANPSFGKGGEDENKAEKEHVALVTPSARPGDVIVQLRGGRVAYVVNSVECTGGNELDGCKFSRKRMSGMRRILVGECLLMRNWKGVDREEDGFGGIGNRNRSETLFIFQEWDGVSDVKKTDQWSSF
ncbi:hypothetical protein BKA61DRAFT_730729 [Leptodontidium sp. MPI-SDFR-AT-0119]|nr:hypothetical protein BKA61DRAFT_730729 [Leptodontidium sp. MPI-SDFR-AT-0119]